MDNNQSKEFVKSKLTKSEALAVEYALGLSKINTESNNWELRIIKQPPDIGSSKDNYVIKLFINGEFIVNIRPMPADLLERSKNMDPNIGATRSALKNKRETLADIAARLFPWRQMRPCQLAIEELLIARNWLGESLKLFGEPSPYNSSPDKPAQSGVDLTDSSKTISEQELSDLTPGAIAFIKEKRNELAKLILNFTPVNPEETKAKNHLVNSRFWLGILIGGTVDGNELFLYWHLPVASLELSKEDREILTQAKTDFESLKDKLVLAEKLNKELNRLEVVINKAVTLDQEIDKSSSDTTKS